MSERWGHATDNTGQLHKGYAVPTRDTVPDMTISLYASCDSVYHTVREAFTVHILVDEAANACLITVHGGDEPRQFRCSLADGRSPILNYLIGHAALVPHERLAYSLPERVATG